MEDLEKLLGETNDRTPAANSREGNVTGDTQSPQWCLSCQKKAEDLEEKYSRNFVAIKQKVFFTDNLIQMYQRAKKQLAEVTDRCNQAIKDKGLVQAQLELLLSKERPSESETEALRVRNISLVDQVEDLKTRLHAMDESRKLHEESLKVLKAEGGLVENELRRKYSNQISGLKKELAEKSHDHKQLMKRCNRLQQRVDRLTKKHNSERHTDVIHQTKNTSTPEQSLNKTNIDAEDTSDTTESSKPTEEVQTSLPTELKEKPAEPKDTSVHLSSISTSILKDSVKDDILGSAGKKGKSHFPTLPTELQIYDLNFIATKWKEISSLKPIPKKHTLLDELLKNISEFCIKHQIRSRNSVLQKFHDLHKDLYSIRHRRWINDILKGGDVTIKKSASPDIVSHISHSSNQDATILMSSADDSETTDEPLGTVLSEKHNVSATERSAFSPKHTDISLPSSVLDHVSVMPDVSDNTVVDMISQHEKNVTGDNPFTSGNLPAATEKERKISEDMDANAHKSEKIEEKVNVAHIVSDLVGDESETVVGENLCDVESNEKEIKNSFSIQLTDVQLSDLAAIATKWRGLVCKRPARKKQSLLDKLLEDISGFCFQHNIESRKFVLEKFYDLHHNLYSKKHRQWLMDTINKSDDVIRKPSSPVVALMSNSAKEDETKTSNNEEAKNNPSSIIVSESQESVGMKNAETHSKLENASPISSTDSSKHVSGVLDGTTNVEMVTEESEPIARKSQSVAKRKREISDSDEADKVPRLDEFHLPQIAPRRRTRSMRASSSSEQEDAKEPVQRSRKRKCSRSSGGEKRSQERTLVPTVSIRKLEEEVKKKYVEFVHKKVSLEEDDNVEKTRDSRASRKNRKLFGVMENTESISSPKKAFSMAKTTVLEHVTSNPTTDSPVESLDLLDIFNEMLPYDFGRLSPLPQLPFKNPITNVAGNDTVVDIDGAEELEADAPLPDDHRGRDSISPSTDLCTVLNFSTPKRKVLEKTLETKQTNKMSDLEDEGVLPKEDVCHSTTCAIIDSESASDSTLPESPLLCETSVPKDIMKPRRFSCEAPEKAVSVPPIKPTSTASSLERIRSPLVVLSTGDLGQKSSFPPLRNDADIPSHWHQSTSQTREDKSDMEKDLLISDDEEPLASPEQGNESTVDDANPDFSACSDYDTDLVIKDMTRSSPLLSAIESGTDLNESPKSEKHSDVDAEGISPRKSSLCESKLSSGKKGNSSAVDRGLVGSGASSADDKSLIIDLSDDIITDKELELDFVHHQAMEENESTPDSTKSSSLSSNPGPSRRRHLAQNESTTKISSQSHSKKIVENLHCISTTRDFKSFFIKGRNTKSHKVVVKESFIAEGITSILEDTTTEFDLSTKDCDDSESYTIEDLPECERRFLRQIHLLHESGMVEPDFLTKGVLPALLKMHEKLGNCYSDVKKFLVGEGDDACYAKLHPFFSRVKSTLGVSLARMLAFMRVFVFVCKMADTVAPIRAACRYHLLWTRATKLIVSLIQGLLCWPTGLKRHPVLGKTVMRVLRKSLKSSQVLSRKSLAAGLVKQLDWIDKKCGWQTMPAGQVYHLTEVKSTIDDAISRIEAAAFSVEFEKFLESGEKHAATLHSIPVFDHKTMIGIHLLEFIPKESVVDDVKSQVFDRQFWPLLNAWSQHLHIHGDVDENRKVSNACTMALLHSFSQILSAYLLRQRLQHKDQPTVPRLQSHYRVICSLMDNLATLYLHKAPRLVQCATASFLIRTCFCNPTAAYQSLLKWAKATKSQKTSKSKTHKDLPLVIILSECEEQSLKQICIWLDGICSSKSGDNLSKCLWPG